MANETVNIELIIQAGRSAQTLGDVKQSIKDVNEALKQTKIGTEEWDRLHEVFLKNRTVIKSMRQEFAGLKQIESIGKAATASFAAATASITLFADGNEKLEKSLRKTAASLELMMAVKELARSMRELQIANEGVNASLLTNPYVLLATVVLAVGAAFISSADDSTEFGAAINNLKDESGGLSMVWEVLKEGVKGFVGSLADGTTAVLKFVNNLAGVKDTSGERKALDERLKIFAQAAAAIKNQSKIVDEDLQVNKSATTDKVKLAQEQANAEKKKFEVAQNYQKAAEQLWSSVGKMNEDQSKEFQKQAAEVADLYLSAKSKAVVAENELKKTINEVAKEKALKEEKAHIKDVLEGYNDILEANKRNTELMKVNGEDAAKISKTTLEQNAMAAEYLREEIDELNRKNKLDEEQKQLLEQLIKLQGELSFQTKLQNAEDAKKAREDDIKKQLELVDQMKTKYEILNKTLTGNAEAMKSAGETEDKIWQQQINNVNQLTNELEVQMSIVQTLNISDQEKNKILDEYKVKLADLQVLLGKVNAEMDGWNKKHVFSPSQQKEVIEFEKGLQVLGQVWGKVSGLITQITDQESQKRIAIYENENRQATAQLDKQLQYGLISQAQYNIKKQQMDNKLADEKRAEQVKDFKVKKELGIVQAVINTALSVTEALSSLPPPASYIMAAVSAAMGAVEIGTIAASQPPAFATGGLFTNGGSVFGYGGSTDDAVNARLSNGESVINAKSTKAFAPLLSAINQIGGGVAFAGQPNVPVQHSGSAASPSKQPDSAPQRVFVTEYDITRTQNKVAVIQNRSSF